MRGLAIVSRNNAVRVAEIGNALSAQLPRIETVAPSSLDELHQVVRQSAGTAELLVAVGGDGTLHQVLNSMDPGTQALGTLPMGTGNDFARLIGYEGDLAARVVKLTGLSPQATDFGTVAGYRYINSAGIGLDSATLDTRQRLPRFIARSYTLSFCWTLARMQPLHARVSADGYSREGRFWWLLAMNNQHIGGGTRITPMADIADGKLDMLLVDRISKPAMLALMPSAIRGDHLEKSGVHSGQFAQISVKLLHKAEWLALDGELHPFEGDELTFSCVPGGLNFLR